MSSEVMQRLDEVRRRAGSQLSSSGSAQDVRADVQQMASMALSPADKYRHIAAETMLRDNAIGSNRLEVAESLSKLVKALSILEKYGCNLTNPNRPRFWRSVKHNNPVFRASVDAIKGGRAVLHLYGYTSQQIDGLSFPDDVSDPDVPNVSAMTLEVMTLRSEMDMLIKETHPHPELFKDIVPLLVQHLLQQEELACDAVIPPEETQGSSTPRPAETQQQQLQQQPNTISTVSPPVSECNLCGGTSTLLCVACGHLGFCDACDDFFHRHPSRAVHQRDVIHKPMHGSCSICGISSVNVHCSTCGQKLCVKCDRLYHSHPDRTAHNRTTITPAKPSSGSPSLSPWQCSYCTTVNEVRAVLCATCERPRLATPTSYSTQEESMSVPSSPMNTEWQCRSCTVVNQGSGVLCEVCERPRLATRPPVIAPLSSLPGSLGGCQSPVSQWVCQECTYVNLKPTLQCEMCASVRKEPAAAASSLLVESSPSREPSPPQPKPRVQEPGPPTPKPRVQEPGPPQPKPRVHKDLERQKLMRDDGLKLIHQIREAEKRGFCPEEVYAALCLCGGSDTNPCDWLTSELPHLLDEICAMALSVQQNYNAGDSGTEGTTEGNGGTSAPCSPNNALQLSRAEAKQAWLAVGGDTEKAVTQLLRDRQAKMRELRLLGFRETSQCEEALRLSGGDIREALSLLQRPLLEPFHQRIWSEQPEAPFDAKHPDKQRLCRRLLALYELPSWGRCELALSLLQEEEVSCSLEDVVQAVKESQDRDFIRRVLNNECPCCFSNYPRSKMQSLTSCQCSVCQECFSQHFTIAVKEKHIRDMVCPVCSGPDINDAEQLDSYFSTLDIQLKACLENDVYNLYHKKLTEHTLMMDPKFLWCCLCTFGFIYDGDQLKVTCPSCNKSFCSKCKKPWEGQHQDMTCDQFQQWKRDNDPEYQKQGLACFLRDNGITCPHCRFQYALTKGGCIHFSCSQCRYQFCSGCNNPFHTTACKTAHCKITGLHAHHPRDCLFYLRDWEPARLQTLLQRNAVEFNTDPPNGTQTDACGVMEQKDEGGQQMDSPCGIRTQPEQAGLCEKHYKEYLVSLINSHSLDPAILYDDQEMAVACDRYQVDLPRADNEEDNVHAARLLKKLMEVPLGEKVPGRK